MRDPTIDQLVYLTLYDWVDLGDIVAEVKTERGARTDDEIRRESMSVLRQILREGLFRPGNLTKDGMKFIPWEMSREQALARIEHEWRELGRLPRPGDICWLEGTEKARALAEALPERGG